MNAVILPSGQVLALGGSYNDEDTTTASLNADLFDANAASVGPAGANAYARLYHSVVLLLPDATVWLAGGNPQRGTYEQNMEIYQPPYLFTSGNGGTALATRPTISSAPANISYGNAFTVQTPDAANISSVVLVRNGAVTHAFDMDQSVVQGNGTTYTVNVAGAGGYSGTVGLSVSGLPTGATGIFNPTSIAGSGASTLTIGTASSTPAGSYKLTITGTDGASLTHTTSVTLVVSGPSDFTISATPASQTVRAGSSASYTVNIAGSAGFSGTVALSVSGLPRKINASFNPSSVVGSGTSTLKISPNPQAPHGTFTVTITG